jgi:PAS domain S-box-containing protein
MQNEDRFPMQNEDRFRLKAEERLSTKKLDLPKLPEKMEDIVQELRIHQAQVQIQNEALMEVQGRCADKIAESRRIEEELRFHKDRLALTLEASGSGAWDWNLITDEQWWSPTMFELRGVAQNGAAPDGKKLLGTVAEEDRQRIQNRLHECWNRHEAYREEFRIDHPTRGKRWMASSGRTFYDRNGRPVRMVGINFDITERKEMEEELRSARRKLEMRVRERTAELAETNAELERRTKQLSRLSSELTLTEFRERRRLAQVIHDHLQQVLVGAKINLEILSSRIPEDQRNTFQNIHDLLVNSIKISRFLTGELSPPVLYERGLTAAIEWLARWMKEKYDLSVELVFRPETVETDEDFTILLFQSIRELLFNVVKHARTASARIEMSKEGAGLLRIVVSDKGKGFDPERMWMEADPVPGFGLFSIRERMELLGGRLEVDSTPGRGSAFTLIAPTGRTGAAGIKPGALDIEGSHPAEFIIAPISKEKQKIRVMLVDDHAVMRQGLSSLLGHQTDIEIVGEAEDGQAAVELARAINPDVILMDISMPKMNGIEATRAIHPDQPNIRIIGLSMFDAADQAAAMLEAGAAAYLTKSGNSDALLSAIRSGADENRTDPLQ